MKELLFILLLLAAGCTIKKNREAASPNPIHLSKKTKEELIKQMLLMRDIIIKKPFNTTPN